MRVAIFSETAPPNVNGVVRRLDQTIGRLREAGDEVLVFAPSGRREWCGAEVVRVPSFPLPLYPEIAVGLPRPALRYRLAQFDPDLVHVVNPAALGVGGLFYARSLGVPVLASFHTHLPRYLRHYGARRLEPLAWELLRTIHNQAHLNLCISEPVAAELRQRGVARVEVAWRGGVDAELFHPRRASPALRARLTEGHPDSPLVVAVGRLGAEKGLELLADVLPGLPGARLALIGDGPHRPALEARFRGLPVHFAGYLAGLELAGAVASADALIFPSETDTLGLAVLESMAAGTAVVACASGGVTDLVRDGHTGLLFPGGDARAAAAALRRVLEDPVGRELLRLAGREQAERWSWDAAVADLRSRYLAVIDREAAARAA